MRIAILLLLQTVYVPVAYAQLSQPATQKVNQLNARISQLEEQGDHTAVLPLQQEIIRIGRRELGDDTLDMAYEWNYLGDVFVRLGQYSNAEAPYAHALKVRRRLLGEDHKVTGESYFNNALVMSYMGDYGKSEKNYLQALRIAKKVGGPQHEDTLQILNNLGLLYQQSGKYELAQEYLVSAVEGRLRTLGPNNVFTGESYLNLGLLKHTLGDYNAARDDYSLALSIFNQALGSEHEYTLQTLNNMSKLAYDLGDATRSYEIDQQVYEIRVRVLGADHVDIAQSLNNMAFNHSEQESYETARKLYQRALDIYLKQTGENDADTQMTMMNLAAVLQQLGETEQALELAGKALRLRRTNLGKDHVLVGETLEQLGEMHLSGGRLDEAQQALDEAYDIFHNTYGDNHPTTLLALFAQCHVKTRQQDWAEVLEMSNYIRRLIRTTSTRLMAGLSPKEQLRLLELDSHQELAFTVALNRKDDQAYVNASAGWAINSKGMAQATLAAREMLMREVGDSESKKLNAQLLDIRRQLAGAVLAASSSTQTDAQQKKIEQLTQQENEITRQLSRKVGSSVELENWIDLENVRDKIADDESLITWIRFRPVSIEPEPVETKESPAPRYLAWIIPSSGQGEIKMIDLGLADKIDTAIQNAQDAITSAGKKDGTIIRQGEPNAEAQLRASFAALTQKVWLPVAQKISPDTKRLSLSPDGALWLVPWPALPLGEDRYLIEQYAFRLLISGREFVEESRELSENRPLVFANPTFDLSPQKVIDAIKAIFADFKLDPNANRGFVSQTAIRKVPTLPNTELEAEAISPSLEKLVGKPPTKYLRQYALESVVKRVHRPRMLVLSTHGYFLPDQKTTSRNHVNGASANRSASLIASDGKPIENPLLRCGLLLAGCNQAQSGGDDGVLTGLEIVGLDLRGTELVVLSACQTGIGKVQIGEGIAGLRQAFQLAGAHSVVATLWQVPDRDSAILMRDFFDNLAEQKNAADALRAAQLARIESRRQRYGAAHPYFWAAWTFTGK